MDAHLEALCCKVEAAVVSHPLFTLTGLQMDGPSITVSRIGYEVSVRVFRKGRRDSVPVRGTSSTSFESAVEDFIANLDAWAKVCGPLHGRKGLEELAAAETPEAVRAFVWLGFVELLVP